MATECFNHWATQAGPEVGSLSVQLEEEDPTGNVQKNGRYMEVIIHAYT